MKREAQEVGLQTMCYEQRSTIGQVHEQVRLQAMSYGVSSLELLPPPGGQPAPRTTGTAVRSRSSLEHSKRDALGAEHHGTATRNRRTSRNGSGQENGPAEVPGSSATRSRQQQDEDHDNEAQSGGGSRASRSSRSQRSSNRIRYAEDEDEDDAEVEEEYEEETDVEEEDDEEADFEEEEDDEKEDEEEVEESTTRRSRRASQQRSVLEVSPATESPRRQSSRSRMVARHQDEVSPPTDLPCRESSRSRMITRYQDERSDTEMRDEEEEFRIAMRKKKDSRNSRQGSPRETEPAAETESPPRRHTPRARAARSS